MIMAPPACQGMLTAAIVAASGCRFVCLRAYACGQTGASCRWVRGQMRRDRGPRHLVAMDATIEIDGLHKRFGETQALDGRRSRSVPAR